MPREAAGLWLGFPPLNMTPDPAALEEPWLLLDAEAPDISDSGNRLECWSHVGGYADVYLCASPEDSSPLTQITRPHERLPAQARIKGRQTFLEPARLVLTYLLDGIARGAPVVLAAPLAEFGVNGCVAPTLIVLEALFPRRWSDALYMRGFTRDLGLFLDELRCHLIAVPRDMAEAVFEVRRDAILLDERGRPAEVQQPSAGAARYADEICDLAARAPDLLEPVLSRFERAAPDPFRLPKDAGEILALAEALSGGEDLEKSSLNDLIGEYPQLLDADDCPLLSESALFGVALSEPPALHEAAVLEIERRVAEDAWSSNWEWDRCLDMAPSNAMEALLATGQWQQWRDGSRSPQPLLREAAVSWCGSRHWRRHEPRLEDWVQIVRDLDGRLSDSDRARMTDSERGSSPFPPIAWFESEQQADLDALAENVEIGDGKPVSIAELRGGLETPGEPAYPDSRVDSGRDSAPDSRSGILDAGPQGSVRESERAFDPLSHRATAAEARLADEVDDAEELDEAAAPDSHDSSRILMLWVVAILAAAVIGLTLGLVWNR